MSAEFSQAIGLVIKSFQQLQRVAEPVMGLKLLFGIDRDEIEAATRAVAKHEAAIQSVKDRLESERGQVAFFEGRAGETATSDPFLSKGFNEAAERSRKEIVRLEKELKFVTGQIEPDYFLSGSLRIEGF